MKQRMTKEQIQETLTNKYIQDTFSVDSFTIEDNNTFFAIMHDSKKLTDCKGNSLIIGQSNFDETIIVIYDNEIDQYRYHEDKNVWELEVSELSRSINVVKC